MTARISTAARMLAVGTLGLCAVLTTHAGAYAQEVPTEPGPSQPTHADAIRYADDNPNAAPPGANDPGCVPSPDHPNPVVLVHGTDASAYEDWAGFTPILKTLGYCVFALNYGASPDGTKNGFGPIEASAAQLGAFVDSVRADTGAAHVDVVGYSQGAAVARYYTNRLGGDRFVDKWIGIASPTYGGTFYGLVPVVDTIPGAPTLVAGEFGQALVQLMAGSDFLTALNSGGDTVPGVHYTSIATDVDETIQPYTNALFRDPGVDNLVVQDVCPDDNVAHFTFTYDPTALRLALNALSPGTAVRPTCTQVPLGSGILDVVIASHQ